MIMEVTYMKNFSKYFDHTLLKPDTSSADIDRLCEEAAEHGFASVCVNGCRTAHAYEKLKNTDVKVATVVGFPLGAMSAAIKVAETRQALADGASEIDMVINIGAVKDGNWSYVREEIVSLADICHSVNISGSQAVLKVILETCLLTDDDIMKLCEIAEEAGADFVKTSTGFSTGGATIHHVRLMKECVGSRLGVKASGGIRTLEDAEAFINAGADRLGCSASVSIMKEYYSNR